MSGERNECPNSLTDPTGLSETFEIIQNSGDSPPPGQPAFPPPGPPGTTTPGSPPNTDWTSANLNSHYFNGGGKTYDISGDINVLRIAREWTGGNMAAIENEYIQLIKDWLSEAKTKNDCPETDSGSNTGPYTKTILHEGYRAVNYWGSIQAIGRANMYIRIKCVGEYTCQCCKGRSPANQFNKGSYKCSFNYNFWDRYHDAADWVINTPAEDEYEGGTAFNIVGSWTVKRDDQDYLNWSCK